MSVIDLLTRVDSICKKYDKYDLDKQNNANVSGDDAFVRLYASVDSDIESLLQVSRIFFPNLSFLNFIYFLLNFSVESWKSF